MERRIIDLPRWFGQLTCNWVINPRGRSAGNGVTGTGQVVYGIQPRWETTLDLAAITPDQMKIWRAIQASLRGRINVLRVPIVDFLGHPGEPGSCLYEGEVTHDDGTGFAHEWTLPVDTAHAAGAEEIVAEPGSALDLLQPGMWFSHDDWPYMVIGIEREDDVTRYSIEPPLRRDIPAGAEITLSATALMVMVTDLDGRMPVQRGRLATAAVNLYEWTNRP